MPPRALAAHAAAGGAGGALEGPAPNAIDLLFHGAGEGDDFHRRTDEVVPGDLGIGEARLGERRHYALLDLGAAPAFGELRQLAEVDGGGVHAAAVEVCREKLRGV